jgi:hypothetical protein
MLVERPCRERPIVCRLPPRTPVRVRSHRSPEFEAPLEDGCGDVGQTLTCSASMGTEQDEGHLWSHVELRDEESLGLFDRDATGQSLPQLGVDGLKVGTARQCSRPVAAAVASSQAVRRSASLSIPAR